MSSPDTVHSRNALRAFVTALRSLFSLREDRADDRTIDTSLRGGAVMLGTNLWVLIFAIFVASIGLNVNSTAVIIGAMLISPLMGPIMGVGYGVGILDFALVRTGLGNLGIATLIALLTSALYFAITPLTGSQSELLARTTPTIWDVLIATFGGLAGIIGVTRREKSNVIPGVAIATALMPPLCTAGFGLANGKWTYFFGALYLFAINSVFIGATTALVTRALRIERRQFPDPAIERRVRYGMAIVLVLTLLPSLHLAYRMVQKEIFRTRATQFVRDRLELERTHVSNLEIDADAHRIDVTLIGDPVPESLLNEVAGRLQEAGLIDAKLRVYQAGDQRVDVATLRSSLLGDLYRDSQEKLEQKEGQIQTLRDELATLHASRTRFAQVPGELAALYPEISRVLIADASEWDAADGKSAEGVLVVNLHVKRPLSRAQRQRIEAWLRVRAGGQDSRLYVVPD